MPNNTPGWFAWTTSAELGEAVLTAREAAGMTQAELAARARVSRKFVFELERGKGTLRIDKVAALVHCLIAFHPFKDGNEATALVAADVCLRLNGRRLLASDAVGEYFRSIAAGGQEPGEIAAWLAQHTEPWGEG